MQETFTSSLRINISLYSHSHCCRSHEIYCCNYSLKNSAKISFAPCICFGFDMIFYGSLNVILLLSSHQKQDDVLKVRGCKYWWQVWSETQIWDLQGRWVRGFFRKSRPWPRALLRGWGEGDVVRPSGRPSGGWACMGMGKGPQPVQLGEGQPGTSRGTQNENPQKWQKRGQNYFWKMITI